VNAHGGAERVLVLRPAAACGSIGAVRETPAAVIEWEGVAAELSAETGCDSPPVDAFELADCCDLTIEPAAIATAQLDHSKRLIKLNVSMRRERQHMSIAHEVGHFALIRAAMENTCPAAVYVAGALVMPWKPFDRDLARTAWSLTALRERHVNASVTALAVRITQLRDAVVTILDPTGRKKPWRIVSPWVSEKRFRRVSAWERDLARHAYDAAEELRGDELCYAVPLLDGPAESTGTGMAMSGAGDRRSSPPRIPLRTERTSGASSGRSFATRLRSRCATKRASEVLPSVTSRTRWTISP
jgi:hypothetical protein